MYALYVCLNVQYMYIVYLLIGQVSQCDARRYLYL